MTPIKDQVVLITGASSGIGTATAERLAAGGAKLMLGARREDRLQALVADIEKAGGEAAYEVTDVTDRQQCLALAEACIERFGHVDTLFNNAGLMPLSPLAARKVDEWDRMVDVNIKGLLYAIDSVLTPMLERGSGHIINVASVAGHTALPAGAVYCGTKFAVRAISESLRQEVKGKLRVSIISPGAVDTELTDTITHEGVKERIGEVFKQAMDPDAIARAVEYAMAQPQEVGVNEIVIRPTAQ